MSEYVKKSSGRIVHGKETSVSGTLEKQADKGGSADQDDSVHAKLTKEEEKQPINQEGVDQLKRDENSEVK